MNSSMLGREAAVTEDMDSLMLHSDLGGEFEESTEALLNSILRVDVVQLEPEDEFAECHAPSYGSSSVLYTSTNTSKKNSLQCCTSFQSGGKDKQTKRCDCSAGRDTNEACSKARGLSSQSRERRFECKQCDRRFLQLSVLEIHKKQHKEEQSCVCDACNASFSEPHALLAHREHCSHKTAYRCNMCIATFATRRRLSVHKRIHVSERPFPCDFCGACFLRKSSLSAHLRAKPLAQPLHKHLGNLSCVGCKLTFISFCGKLKHCQVLHPESVVITENNCSAGVTKDAKALKDVEILFSVDVGNLVTEEIQEEAGNNTEEESEPFPKVIVAYTEAGPDGESRINYEFVSDSDGFPEYSFVEQDDPLEGLGSCEEGASR